MRFLERVWDYDFDPNTNVVEARVSRTSSSASGAATAAGRFRATDSASRS